MKRRICFIVCFILVCLLPLCAGAVKDCPDHPGHKVEDGFGWSVCDDVRHKWTNTMICDICYRYLGEETEIQWHRYSTDSSPCSVCGHQRPSKSSLSGAAYIRDDLIGCEAWTLYAGSLYTAPENNKIGSLSIHQDLIVLDYEKRGTTVWLQVRRLENTTPLGWINAEIASVCKKNIVGPIPEKIRITVGSGRARADAGTEYPYIEGVTTDEVYKVMDWKTASTGTIWYNIIVDGRSVWVSSGITEAIY